MCNCFNEPTELSLTFKNWENDDVILELARYIEKGYHLISCSHTMRYGGTTELEVNLVKVRR